MADRAAGLSAGAADGDRAGDGAAIADLGGGGGDVPGGLYRDRGGAVVLHTFGGGSGVRGAVAAADAGAVFARIGAGGLWHLPFASLYYAGGLQAVWQWRGPDVLGCGGVSHVLGRRSGCTSDVGIKRYRCFLKLVAFLR